MPRAHCADAGHRRRAGAGTDARADRARLAGPRLHSPSHAGLGRIESPRPALAAGTRRRRVRRGGGANRTTGARLRPDPAGRHPAELRHAARARRRQRGACHRLPAGAGGRVAASGRRRAAQQLGPVSGGPRRLAAPRAAGRPPAAHPQHEHNWQRLAA